MLNGKVLRVPQQESEGLRRLLHSCPQHEGGGKKEILGMDNHQQDPMGTRPEDGGRRVQNQQQLHSTLCTESDEGTQITARVFRAKENETMSYTLELEIEKLPKMPNEILGRNWRAKSYHAKVWKKIIRQELILKKLLPEKPLQKARVCFTRYSSKEPDTDGLYGSFKPVLDALVSQKEAAPSKARLMGRPRLDLVLEDDAPKFIELECKWEKVPRNQGRIKIFVESI